MSYLGVDTNISQPVVSQSDAESGRVNNNQTFNIGGLNVPQYPNFSRLEPVKSVAQLADNTVFYVVVAGSFLGLLYLFK